MARDSESPRPADRPTRLRRATPISAVDVFCGAGGLTHGLLQAGVNVVAGIDIDPQVEHAYTKNNPGAKFLCWDVAQKDYSSVGDLFPASMVRLLAGCAPCQPFSKLTNGIVDHTSWNLLGYFGRFVKGILPELVTMENVPELAGRGRRVFDGFLRTLQKCNYHTDWRIVNCAEYGIPQTRRRLVVLASRLAPIAVPDGPCREPSAWRTVRQAICDLPPLRAGEDCPDDALHVASRLSTTNLKRIMATRHDGGTWSDWPDSLVLSCHRKESGQSYYSIYGRMWWDRPAPTMTTLCIGLGNGRFGHPTQDRAITLREAALFQSFPRTYHFWPAHKKLNRKAVSRMIGNAVPPVLARALGETTVDHVNDFMRKGG